MQIEFFGLPGAGKTTLRRLLLSDLQKSCRIRCISSEQAFLEVSRERIDKILRLPLRYLPQSVALSFSMKLVNGSKMQFDDQNRFMANHGAALGAFLDSAIHMHMSSLDKQRVIGNLLSSGALWQCLNTPSMKQTAIFFEEGLIQSSFMFVDHSSSNSNDQENVLSYLENIPRTDLVICVSTSIRTARSRMLSRPHGLPDRLRHVDDEALDKFLSATRTHMETVTNWLKENRSDRFIILDNDHDVEPEFGAIKDKIMNLEASAVSPVNAPAE